MKQSSQSIENTTTKTHFSPGYQQDEELPKASEIPLQNGKSPPKKHINRLSTNKLIRVWGCYYNTERSRTQAEKLQRFERLNLAPFFPTLRTFELKSE